MVHEFNAAKLRGVIGSVKASHDKVRLAKVKDGDVVHYWLNWGTGELCLGTFEKSVESDMDELVVTEGL